jgi:hypothetical protein
MSYPTVLYGPEGEQFNIYAGTRRTNQRWPLGTQIIQQDGRKYRFAKAGGADLVIGDIIQAAATVANHVNTTAAANAVGVRTLTTTLGATAATIDQYFQGFAMISVTPGAGQAYSFDTTPVVASAGSFVGTLAAGHAIRVALTTTSRVDLIKSPYDNVIQSPITTATGVIAGVAVSVIATSETGNNFGWLQTRGLAAVLTSGTVLLGAEAIVPSLAAGSINAALVTELGSTQSSEVTVGQVQRVAATAAWSTIFLKLD